MNDKKYNDEIMRYVLAYGDARSNATAYLYEKWPEIAEKYCQESEDLYNEINRMIREYKKK